MQPVVSLLTRLGVIPKPANVPQPQVDVQESVDYKLIYIFCAQTAKLTDRKRGHDI